MSRLKALYIYRFDLKANTAQLYRISAYSRHPIKLDRVCKLFTDGGEYTSQCKKLISKSMNSTLEANNLFELSDSHNEMLRTIHVDTILRKDHWIVKYHNAFNMCKWAYEKIQRDSLDEFKRNFLMLKYSTRDGLPDINNEVFEYVESLTEL